MMLGEQSLTARSMSNRQISKFVAKLGLLFLLMNQRHEQELEAELQRWTKISPGVSCTTTLDGILRITYASFLCFAFASFAAFDTAHDSSALSASGNQTRTMCMLHFSGCRYACCCSAQVVDTEAVSLHAVHIHPYVCLGATLVNKFY